MALAAPAIRATRSFHRVGKVAQARGDVAAAEQAYTQDLAISDRLAALDPTNTDWQEDLAATYRSLGDLAEARGDVAAAEQAYTQELAIYQRLTTLDPANTSWQEALTAARSRIVDVARSSPHPEDEDL